MVDNGYNFQTNPAARPYDLRGKTAIITGGGSGLGEGIAYILAQHGVNIVINGRTESKLHKVQQNITKAGGRCEIYAGDAALESTQRGLVEYALQKFGSLHIAINNSGTSKPGKLTEYKAEDLKAMMDVNINGVIWGLKHQLPAIGKHTTKEDPGCIINISSTAAITESKLSIGSGLYGCTKAFVDKLTRIAAIEGAEYNVRCNAINPGYVHTELTSRFTKDSSEFDAFAAKTNIAGRAGSVEEIANLTLNIIQNKFINGSIMLIDGGYNVWA